MTRKDYRIATICLIITAALFVVWMAFVIHRQDREEFRGGLKSPPESLYLPRGGTNGRSRH